MNLAPVIRELYGEKKRLEHAIAVLEGASQPKHRGRTFMDAAERRAVSERMKKYWANRRNQY